MYAYSDVSDFQASRARDFLPHQWSLSRFWLPVAVIALALYAAEHSTYYASPDFSEQNVDIDVAGGAGSTSVFRQAAYLALGAMGAWLLSQRTGAPFSLNKLLLCLALMTCAWIVLSSLWSDNVSLSLKRSMVPLLIFLGALGVTKHWEPRQVCVFSAVVSGAFVLIGVAAECRFGTFLRGSEYRFAGTLYPNNQAINCAILSLASFSLCYQTPGEAVSSSRRFWLLGFFAGAILLVLTGSRTTTAAYLVALVVLWTLAAPKHTRIWTIGGLIVLAACAIVYAMENQTHTGQALLDVIKMGREQETEDVTSFTGRIPIWIEVSQDIAKNPLFGYGYGAYWSPRRIIQYSYINGWEFDHAHSAYLESLLHVGVCGLVLGLAVIMIALSSAIRAHELTHDIGYGFCAAVLVMGLMHGFLDSNFVRVGFASLMALVCVSIMVFNKQSVIEA